VPFFIPVYFTIFGREMQSKKHKKHEFFGMFFPFFFFMQKKQVFCKKNAYFSCQRANFVL